MSKEKEKSVNAEKLKALQLTLDKIEKSYGKGTIMKLGDSAVVPVEAISTGSLTLDLALGTGGLPRGRVVEIYGPESSGKTTLASIIANETKSHFETFSAVLSGVKEILASDLRYVSADRQR